MRIAKLFGHAPLHNLMSPKPLTQFEHLSAQEKNEEFFEQVDLQFSANMERISFKGLKEITFYKNHDHGTTFLMEMRFKKWQTAEASKPLLQYLRHPWYDSQILKEDVYRIGKSLFLRKLL